jgi:hypothetical protein
MDRSVRQPRWRGAVATALHCYPRDWRARHEDEALEIAALLEEDGVPRSSIAWSYLIGAASHRILGRGTRSLRAPLAALAAAGSVVFLCVAMLLAPADAGAVGRGVRPTTTVPTCTRSHPPANRHVHAGGDSHGRTC